MRPVRPGPWARGRIARALRIALTAVACAAVLGAAPVATAEPGGTAPAATSGEAGATDDAAAGAAEELTRRVQERYDATTSFSASFDQEMRVEAGGQTIRSAGRVWFQRPGKMNWSYESPEPQTIVADGRFLWVYQPEDHQVLKAPLRDAFESRTPVSFLLGVARIEQDFTPALLAPAADGSLRLKLVPKSDPGGSLGSLMLEVDPVTFDLRAASIRDSLGNTTRVLLRDLRRNEPVDEALFRFAVPYGADVIESPAR